MNASPPVTGIGNVILGVRDMQRSLAFYRDALGLAVRFASGDFTFLQAGTVTLCLRQIADLAPGGEERVEIVFDVREIHAAYEALQARGVAFRLQPRVVSGDLWAADFRDPDGHVLSIFGPAATRTADSREPRADQ